MRFRPQVLAHLLQKAIPHQFNFQRLCYTVWICLFMSYSGVSLGLGCVSIYIYIGYSSILNALPASLGVSCL